jgi:hypothetical protein
MKVKGQLHILATLLMGKDAPSSHWKGCWVGPITGLDGLDERKVFWPSRELNHDSSVVQPVAQSLCWLHLSSHSNGSAITACFNFVMLSKMCTEDNTACCQNIRIDKWNVHGQRRFMGPFKQKFKFCNPTQYQDQKQSINIYTIAILYGSAYLYIEILSLVSLLESQF